MKEKTRRRIFFSLLMGALLIGVGVVAYLFYPREKPSTIKVYFFKGEKLFAVERPLSASEAPLPKAVRELLAGPTAEEAGKGVFTQLPARLKVLSVKAQDKTAVLNFNRSLETYSGGTARLQGMIAQIVYTATELPGVEKVWIWVEGQKEVVLGGEGLVLDHPLSRREVSY